MTYMTIGFSLIILFYIFSLYKHGSNSLHNEKYKKVELWIREKILQQKHQLNLKVHFA